MSFNGGKIIKKIIFAVFIAAILMTFTALTPALASKPEKTTFVVGTYSLPNPDYPGTSVTKNDKVIGGGSIPTEYNYDSLGNSWTGTHTNIHWVLDLETYKGAGNGYLENSFSWGTFNYRFTGLGVVTYYGPDLPIGVHYGDTIPGITYEGTTIIHYTDGPFSGKIGMLSYVGVSFPPGSAIGGIYYGTVTILN